MTTENANIRIARNTLALTIRFGIVLLINLYVTRALLGVLGVVDYGVYNVVCGFVAMFAFLNSSMNNGIQRFYNYQLGKQGEDGITKVYNAALIIQAALALLIIVGSETLGLWYVKTHLVIPPERLGAAIWVFQGAVVGFTFLIMQVPFSAIIVAEERMSYFAMVSVLDAIMKLVIVIMLRHMDGDHLIQYGLLFACISIIDFLLYYIYAKVKCKGLKLKLSSGKEQLKEIIGFSGWNIFGTFASMMKEQGLDLILNLFFGPIVNAARGVANQINGGMQSLISNMTTAIRPQVIKSYAAEEYDRTLRLTYAASKLSCSILYMVALPILLEIDYILRIWLNGQVPDHTAGLLWVTVGIWFINNLNNAVSGVIHASGKMMTYQVVTSIISLTGLPAAYAVLKMGGSPEMAMAAVLVFTGISQGASLVIMRTVIRYKISDYMRAIVWPLIVTIVVTAPIIWGVHHIMEEGWLRLIVILAASGIIICPAVYFILFNSDEKALCQQMVRKLLRKS